MRKLIFSVLAICGLAGILLGCSNVLENPQNGGPTGTVLVQAGTAGTEARTTGPSASDFVEYRLVFSQGSTLIPEVMTPDENGRAFNLKPGTWNLTVTGYIEVGGEKKPSVKGTTTVTVSAGKTVQARVVLNQNVTEDAYGRFDYSAINFQDIKQGTLQRATMTITPSNPNQGTVTIDLLNENDSGILDIPAGIYTVLVELNSGRSITIDADVYDLNAYRKETVYINPYMTTALPEEEYKFIETDLVADLYFTGTANIWESTGTDTYKPKEIQILGAGEVVIQSAGINEDGSWELYFPSNYIADDIVAPHGVDFAFTMESQEHPENTIRSRLEHREITNKYGIRDIVLDAAIRKITVGSWGSVEGNSAVKTGTGYDVVYDAASNDKILLTVNTSGNGIISNSVEVRKHSDGSLLTARDDEFEIGSDGFSLYIMFKMPDDDVAVTAEFFIPEGTVGVHATNNSTGTYTARQVFVWLDQDGFDPDAPGDPITVGGVNGGSSWRFDLPPEHQAYSGDFWFQFRLTSSSKASILSQKFRVNVSDLASDLENKISLVVNIYTLTAAATGGDGTITITTPDIRDEYGYLSGASTIPSGDYVAEGTSVEVTVTPTSGNYAAGLTYVQNGELLNVKPAERIPGSGADRIYTFTMPNYNTTLRVNFADYRVGDVGPSGGYIAYVEGNPVNVNSLGWKYVEAASEDVLNDVNLTMNWDTAVSISNGFISASGYSDWELPNKTQLGQMYTNLKRADTPLGDFADAGYWSSEEYSYYSAYIYNFSNGSSPTASKSERYRVRPVRTF
jgi:hypothetical protein